MKNDFAKYYLNKQRESEYLERRSLTDHMDAGHINDTASLMASDVDKSPTRNMSMDSASYKPESGVDVPNSFSYIYKKIASLAL